MVWSARDAITTFSIHTMLSLEVTCSVTRRCDTGISSLQEVPIRNRAIAQCSQLLGCVPVVRPFGHLTRSLRVDPLVVEHQNEQSDDTSTDKTKLESVPKNIARRVLCSVKVGRHG
jgi:hypothetical protein